MEAFISCKVWPWCDVCRGHFVFLRADVGVGVLGE